MHWVVGSAALAAAGSSMLGAFLVVYGFMRAPDTQWTPFVIVVVGIILIVVGVMALVSLANARD